MNSRILNKIKRRKQCLQSKARVENGWQNNWENPHVLSANGFSTRHLAEADDENGVINMKIHNVFIAALGQEIQYYSALARSLDSSLGLMLESMAISTMNKNVNNEIDILQIASDLNMSYSYYA